MKHGIVALGIDPGLANVGYGLILTDGTQSQLIDYGSITTPASQETASRLREIFEAMRALMETHQPSWVAVETLYFAKNTKTAMAVAQARGAALAAVADGSAQVVDITPLQVKQALTGYGRAEKDQIKMMVKTILGLERPPTPDHAADALAVALACAHSLKRRR